MRKAILQKFIFVLLAALCINSVIFYIASSAMILNTTRREMVYTIKAVDSTLDYDGELFSQMERLGKFTLRDHSRVTLIGSDGTVAVSYTHLLRRVKRREDRDILSYQAISVNRKTREVASSGQPVELTLKEFELLVYLLENQARVVTRDELLNQIWGYEYDGETRTLDMHIRTLRQKLGQEGSSCIKTVRGVGYRMIRQEG